MPLEGEGFFNYERFDEKDQHDYGTSWMSATIVAAGKTYQTTYRNARPQVSRLAINDVSLPYGGDTPQHAGHETGLSCDVLLPILPEKDTQKLEYGTDWRNANYDRTTMRAILKAIQQQPMVQYILFNDPTFIAEGLCSPASGHDNHAHFELKVPALQT
jgi:murein endopeptidase